MKDPTLSIEHVIIVDVFYTYSKSYDKNVHIGFILAACSHCLSVTKLCGIFSQFFKSDFMEIEKSHRIFILKICLYLYDILGLDP